VTYTVNELDTDQSSGNVPISVILTDGINPPNAEFTTPDANTLVIDATRPELLFVSISSSNANLTLAKIGDTVTLSSTTKYIVSILIALGIILIFILLRKPPVRRARVNGLERRLRR